MEQKIIEENIKYLTLLSREFPTAMRAAAEIISLEAQLKLPKGTEMYMSDLHGEYRAFSHILNNASGVIREKIDVALAGTTTPQQRAVYASLIYYPAQKLAEIKQYPMYGREYYTAEKIMYLQDRVQFLQKITEAIEVMEQEATEEERQLLYLKFWHSRPRLTDDVIAAQLNISRTTMYRIINSICRKIGMRLGTDL